MGSQGLGDHFFLNSFSSPIQWWSWIFLKTSFGGRKMALKKTWFWGFFNRGTKYGIFFQKVIKNSLFWPRTTPNPPVGWISTKNQIFWGFWGHSCDFNVPPKNGQFLVFGFLDPLNAVPGQKQGHHWIWLEKLLKIGLFQVSQGICWATMRFQKKALGGHFFTHPVRIEFT